MEKEQIVLAGHAGTSPYGLERLFSMSAVDGKDMRHIVPVDKVKCPSRNCKTLQRYSGTEFLITS